MDLLSNDFNDFQETQTNEEIFKEDMAQFETSMVLNSIQSFENKKKKEYIRPTKTCFAMNCNNAIFFIKNIEKFINDSF